jgi:hypothetical protein
MAEARIVWISEHPKQSRKGIDDRAKIRSQAMYAAAIARKESQTWGKRNRRQLPVYIGGSHPAQCRPPDSSPFELRHGHLQPSLLAYARPPKPSQKPKNPSEYKQSQTEAIDRMRRSFSLSPVVLTGMEKLRAEVGIDIMDLSFLTNIAIGQNVSAILGADPDIVSKLAARRRYSFLSFVPARYGHCIFLDCAIRCLVLKASRILTPSTRRASRISEMTQYGKTLRDLQAAMNDPDTWSSPDVLCAVAICK